MKIVSGRTGTPHMTSQRFRQILEGTVGQGSYIFKSGESLEPELVSNNLLKIRSGMMCHHGNVSCVDIGTYDEVELPNGSQGMKRIDLIVNRYTINEGTGVESNNWVVIQGTPVASDPAVPSYTVGNLQEGDLVDDCPVIQVSYDGLNVTEVKKLLSVVKNTSEMEAELAELNSKSEWKILGTAKSGDFVSFPEKWSEIICFCNVKNGTNTNTVSIHVPNFPALLSSGAYLSGSAYVASSDNCFARVKLSSSGLTPQSAYKDNGSSLIATYSIYYR